MKNYRDILEQARVFMNKKDYTKAIDLCTSVILYNPDVIDGWRLRSQLYELYCKYELAISDISKTIEFGYEEPADYFRRGRYYLDIQEYKSAISDFTQVIFFSEQSENYYYYESAFFFRAESLLRECRYEEALMDCEQVSDNFSLYIRPNVRSIRDILTDINNKK
ncbi:MAG: hypothetical protein D3906_01530 [Candidatus Electrothrix sp. AUS1_2]|nr:hypothetical protein [Candidatus Electrothrix sp. AUS1_2]